MIQYLQLLCIIQSYITSLAIVFRSDTSNISEESTIINSLFCNIMFLATHTKTFLHVTTCILGWFPTCVTNLGVSYSHMKLITPNSVISMPYIFCGTSQAKPHLNVFPSETLHNKHPQACPWPFTDLFIMMFYLAVVYEVKCYAALLYFTLL